jgi:hypothetical protein
VLLLLLLVLVLSLEGFEEFPSCQRVHRHVERDCGQYGSGWVPVVCKPYDQEENENFEWNEFEPFQNVIRKMRRDRTAVKNEEQSEKTGNQRLVQWSQNAVDVIVVPSESVHFFKT